MNEDQIAAALAFLDQIAEMSDDEIRRTYCATDGEPDDAWSDALARACEERQIDL